MKAIILAAGQGTRLRPLTNSLPKCMVELVGIPLLQRQVNAMRASGVSDIVVVGGYCFDRIVVQGIDIVVNPAFDRTNMVSTLFCAESHMGGDQDIIVSYGDIVFDPNVIETLLSSHAPVSTVVDRQWLRYWQLRMDDPFDDAESLKLTQGDKITEIGKAPGGYEDIQGQYIGLTLIRADQLARVRQAWHALDRSLLYDGKTVDNMFMTSFLQHLIDGGVDIRAAFINNGWLEVDTVLDLQLYESLYSSGRLSSFISLDY